MFCADFGVRILLAGFDWQLQENRMGEKIGSISIQKLLKVSRTVMRTGGGGSLTESQFVGAIVFCQISKTIFSFNK